MGVVLALLAIYRAWEGRLSPTMRQSPIAGERLFVDYASTD
jgi:transposase